MLMTGTGWMWYAHDVVVRCGMFMMWVWHAHDVVGVARSRCGRCGMLTMW